MRLLPPLAKKLLVGVALGRVIQAVSGAPCIEFLGLLSLLGLRTVTITVLGSRATVAYHRATIAADFVLPTVVHFAHTTLIDGRATQVKRTALNMAFAGLRCLGHPSIL